jgi:hypothetical protein
LPDAVNVPTAKSIPSIGAVLIPTSPLLSILNDPPPSVAISNIFSSPLPLPIYFKETPTASELEAARIMLYHGNQIQL